MTEPSELVERLAAVVDPRYSAEFVGNIVRANWPDIHAALSAMPDPLASDIAQAAYREWIDGGMTCDGEVDCVAVARIAAAMTSARLDPLAMAKAMQGKAGKCVA